MKDNDLLNRFDIIQDKLEAKVKLAHAELLGATDKAKAELTKEYHDALKELNDFLSAAKVQRKRIKLWLSTNRALLIGMGLSAIGGAIGSQIVRYLF